MAYAKYNRNRMKVYGEPVVVLGKSGNADISKAAQPLFTDIKYVELYYDTETKRVGITSVDKANADTCKITRNIKRGWSFTAKGFMQYFNIKVGKYKATWNEGIGMIELVPIVTKKTMTTASGVEIECDPSLPEKLDDETIAKYVAKAKKDRTEYKASGLPQTLEKLGKQMAAHKISREVSR